MELWCTSIEFEPNTKINRCTNRCTPEFQKPCKPMLFVTYIYEIKVHLWNLNELVKNNIDVPQNIC